MGSNKLKLIYFHKNLDENHYLLRSSLASFSAFTFIKLYINSRLLFIILMIACN
ncbi:Uncharacterised protein [Morganella morganii]|nr:Uncharacterised protein [Morganella morganii]